MMRTTCGVVITDGTRIVLGHATGSARWDIFKGLAEPGESFLEAAIRELREETGLVAPADGLLDRGVHPYLPNKALALFAWMPAVLPEPGGLQCSSMVTRPLMRPFPEMDRFGVFTWEAGLAKVGRNLARILKAVAPTANGWCEIKRM